MEYFENYIYGCYVMIQLDYKFLEIIVWKNLYSVFKCFQRMLLRLQNFDYSIEYKKGIKMYFVDILSRIYLIIDFDLVEENMYDIYSVNYCIYLVIFDE